jgi:RNA polymerase sigma-70 factor (ECF subfamily)
VVPQDDSPELAAGWAELARARNGDRSAWQALFARYAPGLIRMTAMITGSPDAARDCVQETFVRLLSSAASDRGTSLRAYLSTIAYRLALKEQQRWHRQGPGGTTGTVSTDPSPLDLVITDDRQRDVARILLSLPDQHREVLVLRFYGEHSYEEIARITGVPLGTVKSRIFNAVKSARVLMKKRGIE